MAYQAVESPSVQQSSVPVSTRKLQHSVDARLDALEPRLSSFYVRLLLLTGVSWAIQAVELALLVFTRFLVANDIGMGTPVLEIFGASIFMGAMAGGPIFGHIADRFGRRLALVIAMVFSLGGLVVSARASAGYMLIIGRVVAGLGFGGQLSSTVVLIQEFTPQSMRGRMVSLLDAFTGIGGLAGLALAYVVAPRLEWRTTYLVTCGLVLHAVVLRFTVPESPRWLTSVGRTEEAIAIVEKIENSHVRQTPENGILKEELDFSTGLESPSSTAKPSRLQKTVPTLVIWILWIAMTMSSYALGIYVPTLISLNGYNVFASWRTIGTLNIAQVVGSCVASTVVDTFGPRRSFAAFAMMTTIFSVALSYAAWCKAIVIGVSFVVTALLSACWSCVLTHTPGYYSTSHRGRGMGYAVGVSRLAAVGGCYLYPHMFNVWVLSVPVLCWVFGGILAVVAVGIVPHFGYQPLSQGDTSDLGAWEVTELESGTKSSDTTENSPSGIERVDVDETRQSL
ncbi:putative transporter svop-1 [Phytophthora citrophthora]|uniref:Transporter svop-1 n=1 Tax=Phytophthora citrophthora TaxID=4793 RepID=A0AAD9GKT4_9STRA|nr:putative transporter svop-1 [Phytophthora citrophthora]